MDCSKNLIRHFHINRRVNKKVLLSRSRGGNIAIFLFLVLICAFMILPLLYAVLQSLKPFDELFAYPPRFFVKKPTFDNFRQMFQLADNLSVPFSRYLFNSVYIAVVGTFAYVLISSAAAFSLAKGKFIGKFLISQLIVWTLLFRPEVTAIPTYVVISSLGMVDSHWSVILPTLAGTMGVFLMKQFIVTAVPDSTLEAARIDGASEYKIYTSIVMPSIKAAWMTLTIFAFQSFWNSTGSTYIYSENLKQLPAVLSSISSGGIARAGAAAAVSVVLMIPPIIIFIISQSSVIETMTHSGLK